MTTRSESSGSRSDTSSIRPKRSIGSSRSSSSSIGSASSSSSSSLLPLVSQSSLSVGGKQRQGEKEEEDVEVEVSRRGSSRTGSSSSSLIGQTKRSSVSDSVVFPLFVARIRGGIAGRNEERSVNLEQFTGGQRVQWELLQTQLQRLFPPSTTTTTTTAITASTASMASTTDQSRIIDLEEGDTKFVSDAIVYTLSTPIGIFYTTGIRYAIRKGDDKMDDDVTRKRFQQLKVVSTLVQDFVVSLIKTDVKTKQPSTSGVGMIHEQTDAKQNAFPIIIDSPNQRIRIRRTGYPGGHVTILTHSPDLRLVQEDVDWPVDRPKIPGSSADHIWTLQTSASANNPPSRGLIMLLSKQPWEKDNNAQDPLEKIHIEYRYGSQRPISQPSPIHDPSFPPEVR